MTGPAWDALVRENLKGFRLSKKVWAGNRSQWDEVLTDGHIALLRSAVRRYEEKLDPPGKWADHLAPEQSVRTIWRDMLETVGTTMRVTERSFSTKIEGSKEPPYPVFHLRPEDPDNCPPEWNYGREVQVDGRKLLLVYKAVEPDLCAATDSYSPVLLYRNGDLVGLVMPMRQ